MTPVTATTWLLLVISLPTASATPRMRLWRALKSLGCKALRDGAYLLPAGLDRDEALQHLAQECLREGGSAWLMVVQPRSGDEDAAYRQLFERAEDHAELRQTWKEASRTLASLGVAELNRLQRKLQREYDALRAIDFFPGEAGVQADAAWADLCQRIAQLLSPGEPLDTAGRIARLDVDLYQGRTWATRRRLWVDRVTSAWLICRFIDRRASFQWLDQASDCPPNALGFDYDGAPFTHVGDRVTFETLMASFSLEEDAALVQLAAMVHQLDVGGEPVPEACGFEAVMAGARERLAEADDADNALLGEMSHVLDCLYTHFQRRAQQTGDKGVPR